MSDWSNVLRVVFVTTTACASDSTVAAGETWCATSFTPGQSIPTSPDACSTTRSVSPPYSHEAINDYCVACTPRCGATTYTFGGDPYYTDTDLPAGACTNEGEKCDMGATAPLSECQGVVRGCAVNAYRCTCTKGEWACVMTSQGGGLCAPCEDAGATDAGGS